MLNVCEMLLLRPEYTSAKHIFLAVCDSDLYHNKYLWFCSVAFFQASWWNYRNDVLYIYIYSSESAYSKRGSHFLNLSQLGLRINFDIQIPFP